VGAHVVKKNSSVIDIYDLTANMYGCQPCPKCGDVHRCVFNEKPDVIQCDHCGFEEKAKVKQI
jgi:predicted RNA-binding Zn-ribbon protein involved in translation (DUF1610 family)